MLKTRVALPPLDFIRQFMGLPRGAWEPESWRFIENRKLTGEHAGHLINA